MRGDPIRLEYLPEDGAALPTTAACFSLIRLPTMHLSYDEFTKKMDQGILGSAGHYGQQ